MRFLEKEIFPGGPRTVPAEPRGNTTLASLRLSVFHGDRAPVPSRSLRALFGFPTNPLHYRALPSRRS